MLIVGTDTLADAQNGSFNTATKVDNSNGKVYVQAVTNDALTSNEVAMVLPAGSTYLATAPEVSVRAMIGFAAGAIASACVGWVQIRGQVSNCITAAGSINGSLGHAISWGATASAGLHCNSSSYQGLSQHVGYLTMASATATTQFDMFLVGKISTGL